MGEPFALYVHVPWCRHVCPYCDFNVYAGKHVPTTYVDALCAELTQRVRGPQWNGRRVKSVYLGGGTPSLLPSAQVARLLDTIAWRCGIVPQAEITLEANPGTVTETTLAGLRSAGVNRLSLGAQSFALRTLQTLGRDHAPDEIPAAVLAARAGGFANLSLDLIFGVPGTTLADWEQDVARTIELTPEHISTYCLTYEDGTLFARWRTSGRLHALDDDTEAAMAERAAAAFSHAGFERYEISSYSRPGRESQHNTSYWDGSDYLGIGAGAHSYCSAPAPGVRTMNERLPDVYQRAVGQRGDAIATLDPLTAQQARSEFCWTALRRLVGIDI